MPERGAPWRDLGAVRRVVVKLGSSTIASVDLPALVDELVRLRRELDLEVAIVTSGAVSCGMERLGLTERPFELSRVQALAAVGQVHLMVRYHAAFARHGVECAQLLLTHEDLSDRRNFLNIRHTLAALFATGVVPVANENDTVATEELRFGDNDRLAAAFATVADADLVILLSDIDALYDGDPRVTPDARPVREITTIDDAIRRVAGREGSALGTGGMASKVQAAELAVEAGIPLIIAHGADPGIIARVLAGEPIGTRFQPNLQRRDRRRHWIHFLSKVRGAVVVDEGAVRALRERGSSLLPIGVVGIRGQFSRGDAVTIEGPTGEVVARGLVGYDHETVAAIQGMRSDLVAEQLERAAVDPVVHRNDLVLVEVDGHGDEERRP